ncbi:MAG TPA: hypothetical protein VNT81_10055, partial [Vicinamibacterales bacterium]|nr:hypothetical protein [Vicinamibacterales bacterium]
LYEQWYPPARSLRENFSEHGRTLSSLMRRIGREPDLAFLLNQVTPEWEKLMAGVADPPEVQNWLPNSERELRAGLLFMNEVIQLMENVYIELDLEQNWAHPDARGWMNLFNHFVWSSMFRVTWAVSASTYGARFQTFCEKRLQLTLGTVQVRIGSAEELNFYERLRFREYSRPGDSLWRIEIHVRSPHGDANRVVFPVGFALRGPDRVLHYVRIMNHVRKMGLWSRARRFMWSRGIIVGEDFQIPIKRE